MNSLAQRFDTNSALKEIKRAKAIVEEDGDTVSDLMWGSNGGFGNLASGIPKFNMPAVPDVSSPLQFWGPRVWIGWLMHRAV